MTLDPRIPMYRQAALLMKEGRFEVHFPLQGDDELGRLGGALVELGRTLEARFGELRALNRLTENINAGLVLDEVADRVYDSFRGIIPYDRIGLAVLEDGGRILRARWARSEAAQVRLHRGFSSPVRGSSLEPILESGEPRILNDLEAYLRDKPGSVSTRLIVEEGMRSSLACPLLASGKPVGFLFFSSMRKDTYRNAHVDIFLHIAGELSTIIEKARLYQEMLELSELKDRFLGMAAHDLRNPLSVIQGYSKLLLRGVLGDVPERQQAVLETVLSSCSRMLELINGLLDGRAIAAGRLDMKVEPVDAASLVQQSAAAFEVLAAAKQIRVQTSIEAGLPRALADPNRVLQVLSNLFDNAVKFSEPETAITLSAAREGEGVVLGVRDEGPGIPADEVPRIFDEFFRASTRPTAGERSTGLGLAIVKRLVEAQRGHMRVESAPGAGSFFSFTLPPAV